MKKTEKINELAHWEKRLKDEGLGIYAPSTSPLNSHKRERGDYQGNFALDGLKKKEGRHIKKEPVSPPSIPLKKLDETLVARLDPACDPRSGGIGGYGAKGLKVIRDVAGFKYNPSSFHAKIGHEGWDFVHVVSSAGITVPRSVDNLDTAAFFTNIASARAAGEQEREATKQVLQGHVPGWYKTEL